MPTKPAPRAVLLVNKIRHSSREVVTDGGRKILHRRQPRGSYTKLRDALLALRKGSVVVPFKGDPKAAKELLGALCRSLTLLNARDHFSLQLSESETAFYVSRSKEGFR